MTAFLILKISVLSLFTLFFLGCQRANIVSANKEVELTDNKTAVPLNSETQKIEGCRIPLPEKKDRKESTMVEYMNSEDGKKFKVTTTTYTPKSDFIFTQESFYVQGTGEIPRKTYKLVELNESKVNDKIFRYIIYAEPISADERNGNSRHVHKEVARCLDFDGDGDFEYLIDDGMTPMVIPRWAAE